MFLPYLVLWILYEPAAEFIANAQGRSVAWALIGFLFGPIGLLVVAFRGRPKPHGLRQGTVPDSKDSRMRAVTWS